MSEFQWKAGSRFPVSAQVAGEELERIARESRGELRPAAVVDESRPDNAPLHPCFEWDDERAADLYRNEQARHVIRSVTVVSTIPDQPPRYQYVSVVPQESGERAYVDTSVVMADAALREQALTEARTLLASIQRRFAHLTELAEVFAAIERIPQRPRRAARRADRAPVAAR